jgi:hypothetical protein
MSNDQQQPPEPSEHRGHQTPPDAEYRGPVGDALLQSVQELKPIAEGILAAWGYDQLKGPPDPPAAPPPDPPASE